MLDALVPIEVFCSYAYKDEAYLRELKAHLSGLQRQGRISIWYDQQILAGKERTRDINEHLEAASIILLLISPDFLDSDYCYGVEMQRALERHKNGEAQVIPIILRPVDWENAPFAHLQSLPRDGKAVTEWDNLDAALRDVARDLRATIEQPSSTSPLPHLPGMNSKTFATASTQTPSDGPIDRNRQRMLKRVHTTWIAGVLDQSLHGVALITLGLEEKADILDNPWRLLIQEVDRPAQMLPEGTQIIDVYNKTDSGLLILGESGAGKTTLLLDLARDLLERAQSNKDDPIPVVFNLSSWSKKRPNLSDWLVEELSIRYEVPRRLGQSWVNEDRLLLLLDGLDEVESSTRQGCIEAINSYRQTHPDVQVVVCSRKDEYLKESIQLRLSTAIVIQPLTQMQIDIYLESAGEQAEALQEVLQQDKDLRELATTPLMLTILLLAYKGTLPEKISELTSIAAKRERIFATYVERMLKRRGALKRYKSEQIMHWLSYLAKQMKRRNQTEFRIERMQIDWLPQGRVYRLAFSGLLALLIGLLFGLYQGMAYLIYGRVAGPIYEQQPSYIFGFIGLVCITIAVAALITLRAKKEIKPVEIITWSWGKMYQRVKQSVFTKIIIGAGLLYGVFMGLLAWMMTDVISLLKGTNTFWSTPVVQGILIGLLTFSLIGIPYLLLLGSLVGWSGDVLNEPHFVRPNQGIHNSARHALLLGFLNGPLLGLIGGGLSSLYNFWVFLPFFNLIEIMQSLSDQAGSTTNTADLQVYGGGLTRLFQSPIEIVFLLISATLVYGLIIGLAKGGFACVQHFVLRFLLRRAKVIPWNYARFLDYAVERALLRRIYGGYIFIHRLLLDYFASLEGEGFEDVPVLAARGASPPSVAIAAQTGVTYREASPDVPVPGGKTYVKRKKRSAALLMGVIFVFLLVCCMSTVSTLDYSLRTSIVLLIQGRQQFVTSQASANSTARALATASPILYPPKNGVPVLDDPLQDESGASGWEVGDPGHGSCKFMNQGYDVITQASSEYCVARATDFGDFIYKVQMKIITGDEGGIIFRIDPTSGGEYDFMINHNGSYRVYMYDPSYGRVVIAQGSSSAILRGFKQTNRIAVVVHGSVIELYVNDQYVDVVSGDTYAHGQIGVIVNNSSITGQTEVIFRNAKVWKL